MTLSCTTLGSSTILKRFVITSIAAVLIGFTAVGSSWGQDAAELDSLKSEIETLKAGQAAIQRDLTEIKRLLLRGMSARAAPQAPSFQPVDLAIDSATILGDESARVALIEFTDYQCPYCRRHSLSTKPQLVRDFVDTGKVRYVVREFPIVSIHPHAFEASQAALCAGDQGKYWEMGTALFNNQGRLKPDDLRVHASDLGLKAAEFEACLEEGKYADRVSKDMEIGMAVGIRGTPSFLLGLADPNDPTKVKATKFLKGAQSYLAFKRAIEELLAEAAKSS